MLMMDSFKKLHVFSVVLLLLMGGCDQKSNFTMCADSIQMTDKINISFDTKQAFYGDVSDRVRFCSEANKDCIDFPFLLSVPTGMSESVLDKVVWEVGNAKFEMFNTENEDFYVIGASKNKVKYDYIYSLSSGVEKLFISSLEDPGVSVWNRCRGHLFLEDLEKISGPSLTDEN